jgi:hypothetical protein
LLDDRTIFMIRPLTMHWFSGATSASLRQVAGTGVTVEGVRLAAIKLGSV